MKNQSKFRTVLISLYITSLYFMYSCCGCNTGDYKYYIINDSRSYYTSRYVVREGCIAFVNMDDKDSTIVCGNYTIANNGSYKPTKSENKYRK